MFKKFFRNFVQPSLCSIFTFELPTTRFNQRAIKKTSISDRCESLCCPADKRQRPCTLSDSRACILPSFNFSIPIKSARPFIRPFYSGQAQGPFPSLDSSAKAFLYITHVRSYLSKSLKFAYRNTMLYTKKCDIVSSTLFSDLNLICTKKF